MPLNFDCLTDRHDWNKTAEEIWFNILDMDIMSLGKFPVSIKLFVLLKITQHMCIGFYTRSLPVARSFCVPHTFYLLISHFKF